MNDVWIFVLGYFIQLAATCLLLWKIRSQRSIFGLSIDTQLCFLVATMSRVVWTLETRLVDTYVAYLEIAIHPFLIAIVCYLCLFKYYYSTTEHAPFYLSTFFLAPLAMILAFFFNPSTDWFSTQILVAFTMYLEGLALLPQLSLMQRMHDVEPMTGHYVALLIVARLLRMVFWIVMFSKGDKFVGLFLGDLLHTLFAMDYAYLYVKRIRKGGRLTYAL